MVAQESRLAIVIDVGDAEKRIKRLREQLAELGGQADDTSDDLGDLGNNANNAGNGAGNLTSASDKARKSIDKMGKAAAIAGGLMAGAIGLSINSAIDFESTIASVSKVVDSTLTTSIDDIADGLKRLSTQIPLSVNELGEIAAAGGQLGVTADDLLGYVETVSKMAVAFDMTADSAGESMAVLSNVLQKPIDQMSAIGDMINEVSNSTPAAASDIVNALKDVGGAFTAFGIADDFAVALTGTMIAVGEDAGRASNALTSMLTTFGTLDIATKRQLGGFDALGINVDKFSQLMKTDAQQAIMDFSESLLQIPSAERLGVATKIFGRDYALAIVKTINANELMSETLKSIELDANGVSAALGSMEKEYQAISATTANKMKLFKGNIDQAAISLGEVFIPALNDLLLNMTPLIATMGAWVAANPELVKQIVLIGGSLLGTVVGLKLAVDGFTAAKETIEGLKAAFTIVAPAVKSAFAVLTGGIGLPLIAIAALIAAGVLLWQNWDLVKEKASELNEWIKSKFGSLPEPLQQAGRDIAAIFMGIWNAGKEYLTLMSELYAGTFESFATIATGAFQIVWSIIKVSFSGIVNTVSASLQIVATLFSGGFALIKNTVSTVLGVIKAVISGDFKAIPGIIGNGLKTAAGIVGSMMTNILNIIKNAGKQLYSIGRDFIKGFYDGIKSMASGVASAASTMVGNAIAAVKKRQDSASPSKVTTKLGGDFAKGMENGIKKGAKTVKSEAQKMAEGAIEAVKNGVAGLKREIALFGNDSALAALDYDIKVGKFGGANTGELRGLTEALEITKKLATANKSVEDSINAIQKQRALFGNDSATAALEYDILNTDRFKDASGELVKQLLEETAAYEKMGKVLKATEAIKARFAQLTKDQEASGKAVEIVMGELQEETAIGKIQADYERRIEVIATFEHLHTDLVETANAARLASDQAYMDAKRDLMMTQSETLFGGLSGLAKSFLGEQSGIYRALFGIQQTFAIASAGIAMQTAFSKALAKGFPAGLADMGMAASKGAEIIGSIRAIAMPVGQAHDGIMSVPKSGTWNLEKGERVLPAHTAKAMDRKLESGGKVVIHNYSGQQADVKTTPDGDTIVTIGKMLIPMMDNRIESKLRQEDRQGGRFNRGR